MSKVTHEIINSGQVEILVDGKRFMSMLPNETKVAHTYPYERVLTLEDAEDVLAIMRHYLGGK